MSTKPSGLYDPRYDHDACGVAFVARLDGRPTHEVVQRGVTVVTNLEHRGATGADPTTGDGAGLLMQMPDALLRGSVDFALPEHGRYGVAVCFLPREAARRTELERLLETAVLEEGQDVIAWRDVPVDPRHVGDAARAVAPLIRSLADAGVCVRELWYEDSRKLLPEAVREELERGKSIAVIEELNSSAKLLPGWSGCPRSIRSARFSTQK